MAEKPHIHVLDYDETTGVARREYDAAFAAGGAHLEHRLDPVSAPGGDARLDADLPVDHVRALTAHPRPKGDDGRDHVAGE